jgi:hypothetical protein
MTYCDFKPGDEVVCVSTPPNRHWHSVRSGSRYVILAVSAPGRFSEPSVHVGCENEMGGRLWHHAKHFSKHRDLSAWLETAATNTDRWDKSVKTPAHPDPVVRALFARIMAGGDR